MSDPERKLLPIQKEPTKREPTLVEYFRDTVFPAEEQREQFAKIRPVLGAVDQVVGTLRQKQILLSSVFWVALGDSAEITKRTGISVEEIDRQIERFHNPEGQEEEEVSEMFDEFIEKAKTGKQDFTASLMRAGWTNYEIKQLFGESIPHSDNDLSNMRKALNIPPQPRKRRK